MTIDERELYNEKQMSIRNIQNDIKTLKVKEIDMDRKYKEVFADNKIQLSQYKKYEKQRN